MKDATGEDGWQLFLKLCTTLKTEQDFRHFFDCFLTLEEKEALAKRYLIVKALLDEGETQREMAERLKVSISKITRGSNALKIIKPHLKAFLTKHME